MNEIEITGRLIDHTLSGSPSLTATFLLEVCGISSSANSFEFAREVEVRDNRPPFGIVTGIAPLSGVDVGKQRLLGSRPDALIATDDLLVLLEFKRVGRLEHFQLVRHASEWAFDVPLNVALESHVPGFALRTWDTVGGWVARALQASHKPEVLTRLRAFATLMESEGLGRIDPDFPMAPPATPVAVQRDPKPTALSSITAAYDIPGLRRRCADLFSGPLHVAGGDTRECECDARRLRAAYAACTEPMPEHLDDFDPMTPYRILTIMYAGENISDAYPKPWTRFVRRVLHRGGDQAVLLAMLAWASRASGVRAKNVQLNVARLWERTPARRPGLEELHKAVDASRR